MSLSCHARCYTYFSRTYLQFGNAYDESRKVEVQRRLEFGATGIVLRANSLFISLVPAKGKESSWPASYYLRAMNFKLRRVLMVAIPTRYGYRVRVRSISERWRRRSVYGRSRPLGHWAGSGGWSWSLCYAMLLALNFQCLIPQCMYLVTLLKGRTNCGKQSLFVPSLVV